MCFLCGACVSVGHTPANAALVRDTSSIQADILTVLQDQSAAWNRGDIDAFMEGYWKSDDLRFASGGDVTYGWAQTNARYKSRYKDRTAMGQLTFDNLETVVLANDAAVLHGRWALERAADRPSGLFTLIFRNFGQGWIIISDTTTSAG
jgi:hypothetical protein